VIRTTRQPPASSTTGAAAAIVPPFEALEARTLFCSEHYYEGLQNDPADFGTGPGPTVAVTAELQPAAGTSQSFTMSQAMAMPTPMLTFAALAAPSTPSSFSATKFSSSGINLTWKDNSTSESGFKIERKKGSSGSWSQIATVGAGVTSYNDTGLTANTYYVYRVRAYNSSGNSSYSNEDGSTTLAGSTPSAIGTLKWSSVASSSAARSEGQSAVIGGKLYVFGGVNTSGPFARSDVYDPSSNSWQRIADLPKKLTHAGTAVVDRNVYFAGGYIGTSSSGWAQDFASRDVWRYNVDSNSYSSMAQLPSARGGGVLVAVGRKLHFISGADASRVDRTDHWVLDLDNTGAGWKTLTSIPSGKSHLGGVALNGKIYVVAGQKKYDDDAVCQSDVHVYDPATNAWTKVANLPRTLSHHGGSTFVYNGRIIVAGGETSPNNPTSKVSAYDPSTNKWTDLASLPSSRTSGAAGAINGALYFATGSVKTNTYKGTFS